MTLTITKVERYEHADGWFAVEVDGLDTPLVLIPDDAFADRMWVYGLETEREALEALVREHAVRMGHAEPNGLKLHERMGGLHPDVEVEHKPAAVKHLNALLKDDKTRMVLHKHRLRRGLPGLSD